MIDKIVIAALTFFLVADNYFLDYYFTVRIGLLLFSICLILFSKQNSPRYFLNGLSKYYIYIWSLCIGHLVFIAYFNYSPFLLIQVPRAISMLFQTFIGYLLSYGLLSFYGSKALKILCLSFICAYIVCIAKGTLVLGPIGLINYAFDFSDNKIAAENFELNKMFEIHSLGLTFPLFLLSHYMYKFSNDKKLFSKGVILLLLFFTLLSLKRISIIAAIITYVIFVIANKLNLLNFVIKKFLYFAIIIAFLIITFVYSPSFSDFIKEHNINVMGRDILYKGITDQTTFSVDYIGKGWAWVSAYMKFMSENDNIFNGILGLHNDILKLYVELGFIGFIILFIIQYRSIPNYLSRTSKQLAVCYLFFQIFAFITYVTDNTFQYWDFQTVLIVIPLCYYYKSTSVKIKK